QVHFIFKGDKTKLRPFFEEIRPELQKCISPLSANMEKRGGGLKGIELRDLDHQIEGYHQLYCTFETRDAMGANFINSCLEALAQCLKEKARAHAGFSAGEKDLEVVMSILANYVPHCLVRAEVRCPVALLGAQGMDGAEFAQ